MSADHHTVIVVGGGPAGSSTAYTLARAGIDVAVVDKSRFPRDKLCGGLLTLRSKKVFQEIFQGHDWGASYEVESNGLRLFNNKELLTEVTDYSQLFGTSRYQFDDYLLSLAKGAGARTYEGESVTDINTVDRRVSLRSGQVLTYGFLVGADGANSVVAKALYGSSFDSKTIGFALEVDIEKELLQREVNLPEIFFGYVDWGYGWIFPKQHSLTVGVGGVHDKNPDMKASFEKFLTDQFGDEIGRKFKGHYVPFGDFRYKPAKDRVLLSGDAAGIVDPVTGEGIAFAMQSGGMAANAILKALSESKDPAKLYIREYKEISNALYQARKISQLIFSSTLHRTFIRQVPRARFAPRMFMDLMADELTYVGLIGYLMKKFPMFMGKALLKS